MVPFFATCAKGLEPVLARELTPLLASDINIGRGGVHFSGDQELLYRANLQLRTAIRILKPILHARVESPEQLYDCVRALDWSQYLTPEHTLAVDANVRDSHITHSHYAALKTKDAICDWFIDKVGRRPNVDVERPMVGLNLHLFRNELTLSLDSSGDSLHKRGYRPIQTKAPLNEALAAGFLFLSEWDVQQPLADPMCGSGTLVIEAALLALNIPPRLTRKHFGFQGWLDYDVRLWTDIRDTARAHIRKELPAPLFGSDRRRDAIMLAHRNARAASVGHLIEFKRTPIQEWIAPTSQPGFIIVNPPYGERITSQRHHAGNQVGQLYSDMVEVFQKHAQGWKIFLFSGNIELERYFHIAPFSRIPLFNGRIPCHLLGYQF